MATALAYGALGCGNDCDAADQHVRDKYQECRITLAGSASTSASTDPVCTDELAKTHQAFARCVDGVSCNALTGKDADGYAKYTACINGQ